MARVVLDFGSTNGGMTPPVFTWFRDAVTHAPLPPPSIFQSPGPGAWTYYFDVLFPIPGFLNVSTVEGGVLLNSVGRTGQVSQTGLQPLRAWLDFGPTNGSLAAAFTSYYDAVTGAALTPPPIFANAAPAWNYFFDAVFPGQTDEIAYSLTVGGVSLSGTLSAPPATNNTGGAQTLLQLRTLIRSESDTEGDPNISDSELTSLVNQSRLRLYGKLVTSFGDGYFVSQAQFATDGINQQFPLPNGVLYGGAPPFFKGELLEIIQGGNVQANAPVTLHPFNLREKNRWVRPFSAIAIPSFFPRYRIVDQTILFTPLPPAGLVMNLWYAPQLAPLVNDSDVAQDWSGWLELVVIDCAIKVMGKQQTDASVLMARKQELVAELDREIANRNLGDPNTVIETEGENTGPFGMPGMGAWGGSF